MNKKNITLMVIAIVTLLSFVLLATYASGSMPSITFSTGTETGHNFYIGSTNEKHYTCATIQGNEVCLSQPYTQYGLEGHTLNSAFTTSQQTSVKNAILQVFNDAGINIDISSCYASTYAASCDGGVMSCRVSSYGSVYCGDFGACKNCNVNASGEASCVLSCGGVY